MLVFGSSLVTVEVSLSVQFLALIASPQHQSKLKHRSEANRLYMCCEETPLAGLGTKLLTRAPDPIHEFARYLVPLRIGRVF